MNEAKKYNNIKLIFSIFEGILSFVLIYLFLKSGLSKSYDVYLQQNFPNDYLRLIIYAVSLGFLSTLVFYPISFYTGYFLEHKYNLSNQTFLAWTWENIKGGLVGLVIGIPILLLFFFVLNYFGDSWWLPFSILMFIISVLLAQIVPVLILPLFYKITPIDNEEIIKRIKKLSNAANMKIENVFKFNMSKDTKKANAAFTGLGKTKRVILGDTLLENFSIDELETVLAHEFGHYKHKHHLKNILISTLSSFLVFYLLSIFYEYSLSYFNFNSITEIGALPILVLLGMLIGLIQTPLSNILSRSFEYQADEYAIRETGKIEEFINTLTRLTDQNMGDKKPHPFVEWFFYSHPSINKRISNIKSIQL